MLMLVAFLSISKEIWVYVRVCVSLSKTKSLQENDVVMLSRRTYCWSEVLERGFRVDYTIRRCGSALACSFDDRRIQLPQNAQPEPSSPPKVPLFALDYFGLLGYARESFSGLRTY